MAIARWVALVGAGGLGLWGAWSSSWGAWSSWGASWGGVSLFEVCGSAVVSVVPCAVVASGAWGRSPASARWHQVAPWVALLLAAALSTRQPEGLLVVWLAPLLAFATTSPRWALFVTTATFAVVGGLLASGGQLTVGHVAFGAVAVLLLAVGERRHRRAIDAVQARAEAVARSALHDELTGLPNRRLLDDRLAEALRQSARSQACVAVMFIDLDQFKDVNDALGHEQGDRVLVEAVRRIRACVRGTDTLARFGADVFTLVLREVSDRAAIDRVVSEVLSSLSAPFVLGEHTTQLTASIGIALHPDDGDAPDTLLMRADQALHRAKAGGRNQAVYFTSTLQKAADTRLLLTQELRGAVDQGQLRLYYQPIVDLKTGAITKAEALVRWQHPTLGMISPVTFIPLAEASGLIHAIGDWGLREAAAQVKRWREAHSGGFQISVNRSPAQFSARLGAGPSLSWVDLLADLGLSGDSIAMEITEGLLLDNSRGVGAELGALREAGIGVSLDDFGTGYSSLAYLQRYPIDVIKIDRAFVRALEHDAKNLALCKAIIQMAHDLGMKVVAEGVETEAEKSLLVAAGCDFAQGFLFGKPMPADDFEALLRDAARADAPSAA